MFTFVNKKFHTIKVTEPHTTPAPEVSSWHTKNSSSVLYDSPHITMDQDNPKKRRRATRWLREAMLGDVTCAICLEVWTNPVTLSCGHTLCHHCWVGVDTLMCPMCRTKSVSPVKVNLTLQKLVGYFTVVSACGKQVEKQVMESHMHTCLICSNHERTATHTRANQAYATIGSLRERLAALEQEASDGDIDEDDGERQ